MPRILPIQIVEIRRHPSQELVMAEPLDVQAALAAVEEPDLRRSIVELGMVQGVAVDGRTAVVAVASPLPRDASRAELSRPVIAAVGPVPGIERVGVATRAMQAHAILA